MEKIGVIFVFPRLEVNYLRSLTCEGEEGEEEELLCCSCERISSSGVQQPLTDSVACEIIRCDSSLPSPLLSVRRKGGPFRG